MEQKQPLGSARVVLWCPNGTNRFVVGGGSELKMYEWNHEKGEVKQCGLRSDLGLMRCFAWSPHSVYYDFLAVGLQTGVVDICRLDQPIPTSPTSLSTIQPPVSLSISSSKRRPCTSLAFCELNPNLLAHGLDKLHTEYSLVIWDLEQSAPSFQASAIDDQFDRLSDPLPNASGFTSRLHKAVLRAPPPSTVSASTIAAKDLQEFQRVPSRAKSAIYKPVQDQNHPSGQYCQAEGINACVFQANSSWEVVAGVNNRLMRYFDLRVRNKAVRQTPTNAVRGICCDPMDGNLIASLDPEKGVYIWDRRKHTHPILMFQEEDAGFDSEALITNSTGAIPFTGKISAVEFCNSRRNVLGTTTRDGSCVRLWNLVTGEYDKQDEADDDASEITDAQMQAWDTRASGHNSTATPSEEQHTSSSEDLGPILSGTRRTKIFTKPVASFDFIPPSAAPTSAPHIVAVSRSGDIDLTVIRDSPRHRWSSRGDLIASVGRTYKIYQTHVAIGESNSREPWGVHFESEDRNSPLGLSSRLPEDETKVERNESSARRQSPAPTLRASLEKRSGPGSSISTPRPALNTLDSDFTAIASSRSEAATTERQHDLTVPRQSRSRPRSVRRSDRQTTEKELAQDISAVMRRRVLEGYGLESAKHNSEIVREDPNTSSHLSDIWLWLHTSNKILQAEDALTHIHGFDFTLKGVLSVWEGFQHLPLLATEPPKTPSQWQAPVQRGRRVSSALSATAPRGLQDKHFGNYAAALDWLNRRNTDSRSEVISLPKRSSKVKQRMLGLSLVGWNLSDIEMETHITQWEQERSSGRAACWSVFMGNIDRGIAILGRSNDERHRLLSAILLAGQHLQQAEHTDAFIQWRDRNQQITARLDDPYARMLLTWFMTKDWQETIQDVPIPLKERVGMALRFFEDDDVSQFLSGIVKDAVQNGDLDAVLLTGINEDAIKILQSYIDHTGDIQTAAIMGALAPKLYVQDKHPNRKRRSSISAHSNQTTESGSIVIGNPTMSAQIEGWFDAYTDLLNGWKLFHHRAQFDIDRGQLVMIAMSPRRACVDDDGSPSGETVSAPVEPVEWVPRQMEMRCMACGASVGVSGPKMLPEIANGMMTVAACPACKQRLPRCVVCRMHMSFPGEPVDKLLHNPVSGDTLDESLIFCQTCRHGGHATHILGWFLGANPESGEGRKHETCAVAGCDCRCFSE